MFDERNFLRFKKLYNTSYMDLSHIASSQSTSLHESLPMGEKRKKTSSAKGGLLLLFVTAGTRAFFETHLEYLRLEFTAF